MLKVPGLIAYNPNLKLSKIPDKNGMRDYVENAVFSPSRKKLVVTDAKIMLMLQRTDDSVIYEDYGLHILEFPENPKDDYLLPPELLAEYEKLAGKLSKTTNDFIAIDIDNGQVVLWNGDKITGTLSRPYDVKRKPAPELDNFFQLYENVTGEMSLQQNITIGVDPELMSVLFDAVKRGIKTGKNKVVPNMKFTIKAPVDQKSQRVGVSHPIVMQTGIYGEMVGLVMPVRLASDEYETY